MACSTDPSLTVPHAPTSASQGLTRCAGSGSMGRAPAFSSRVKQSCRLLKRVLFRLAQVQIGEQPPQGDAAAAHPGMFDAAPPAHEARQQPPRNAVGEQKIDVLLLNQPRDQGSRGHLSVIRLQYSSRLAIRSEDAAITHHSCYVLGGSRARHSCCANCTCRLQLSRAKHRSLAGHSRMARRFASLGAVLRVRRVALLQRRCGARRHRRGAPRRLHAARRRSLPSASGRRPSSPRELAGSVSDLQFTSRYRVPFQFSGLRAAALQDRALSFESSCRRDGHRSRRQSVVRFDRLVRRQRVRLRLLQGVHRARQRRGCASLGRCWAPTIR